MPTLLAPRDVARRLKLSVSRIAQLDNVGTLKALRDSAGRRLYEPETVEAFAREREAKRTGVAPATTTNGEDAVWSQ